MHTGVQMKYVSKLTDARRTSREDESSLLDLHFISISLHPHAAAHAVPVAVLCDNQLPFNLIL